MGRLQKGVNDLKTWCLSNGSWGEQLISEWTGEFDGKKNVGIDEVAKASNKKAKWKCSKGHEWFARILDRTKQKQGCPYCAGKLVSEENSLKTWCLSNSSFGEKLMSEWTGEVEDKINISLDEVAKASHKKAKWKCSKGHEWYVTINSRTSYKTDCPFCSSKRVSDMNSLKTWCLSNGSWGEQLMSEWTGEVENKKNISLEDVTRASHKKAKWKCSKGHEWIATIASRTNHKTGCAYCSGNIVSEENSLKTWCLLNGQWGEQLISEWTGEVEDKKNIRLDEVSFGSQKKAKWKCSKGHEWFATIASRTNKKSGCPDCSGQRVSDMNSLKTWCLSNGSFGHQLMSEWTGEVDDKSNVNLDEVSFGSKKKVKWKCSNGHEWFAMIVNRTSGKQGCPYCSGQIVSDMNSLKTWCLTNSSFGQQLMSEWTGEVDDKTNINLDEVARGSRKKAKWKCSKGHEWFAMIVNRTSQKQGCPFCNTRGTSYPEQFIYHSLKQLYPDTKSRAKAYLPENNQGIEYDISIVSANLCIEYSPIYWHQGREEMDNYKKEISKQYNFRLIQIIEDSFDELEHKFEPDYICFKMNEQLKDEILITIVDYILKSLGHSISEIDIEKVKKDAYESCKGIENDIHDID